VRPLQQKRPRISTAVPGCERAASKLLCPYGATEGSNQSPSSGVSRANPHFRDQGGEICQRDRVRCCATRRTVEPSHSQQVDAPPFIRGRQDLSRGSRQEPVRLTFEQPSSGIRCVCRDHPPRPISGRSKSLLKRQIQKRGCRSSLKLGSSSCIGGGRSEARIIHCSAYRRRLARRLRLRCVCYIIPGISGIL
jgi:hypothetical protein